MPSNNICGETISPCSTIDSSKDDALDHARIAFRYASPHPDTRIAVENLLNCLSKNRDAKRVMIVGHGVTGLIITGTGAVAPDPDKRIGIDNIGDWKPLLAKLKDRITEIVFCSCDTGRDPRGPILLQEVANTTGARCSAFTGMIFIDEDGNITCEKQGMWRYFDPQPGPGPSVYNLRKEVAMEVNLKFDDDYRTVRLEGPSAIAYFVAETPDHPNRTLHGDEADRVLRSINFAEPQDLAGVPLAVVTGTLKIRFGGALDAEVRGFTIYNDRLLQDQLAIHTFYQTSPDFSAALSAIY